MNFIITKKGKLVSFFEILFFKESEQKKKGRSTKRAKKMFREAGEAKKSVLKGEMKVNETNIQVRLGDLTEEEVDCIVNAFTSIPLTLFPSIDEIT